MGFGPCLDRVAWGSALVWAVAWGSALVWTVWHRGQPLSGLSVACVV